MKNHIRTQTNLNFRKNELQLVIASKRQVLIIWDQSTLKTYSPEDSLKQFLREINRTHEIIKFTSDYSTERVSFLDEEVILRNNKIVTDLQYLDFSSCHPLHRKTSIPYSQTLRLNRICSEPEFLIIDAIS